MRKRDEHPRSADFLETEKQPDISVVVTGSESVEGDTLDLRAQLNVKGTTPPMPLPTAVPVLDDGAVRLRAAGHHRQGGRRQRQFDGAAPPTRRPFPAASCSAGPASRTIGRMAERPLRILVY